MTTGQLNALRLWFLDYAGRFAEADGILSLPLQMKLDHSARVAEDCRRIARGEGWSDDDLLTAEAIGWLHDVARFSQFKEFKTFHDPRSVNHGERGWNILRSAGILNACEAADWERILEGVRYHNRKAIPAEASEAALPFIRLIRDADKLDIYEIFHQALKTDLFATHPEILLHVSAEGPVNPAILDEIRRRENPSYQHIHSLSDFLLIQVSWVYDFNYVSALRLFKARRILERAAERLPKEASVCEILKEAEAYVDARIG